MITFSDNDSTDAIYEKIRRKRLSLNDYLYYIRRFVEIGDVLEIEKDVAVEFAWKLYDDPILGYLRKLMNDPVVQAGGSDILRDRWSFCRRVHSYRGFHQPAFLH